MATADLPEAIPTMYDGCRFRSKSEAMFAMYLCETLLITDWLYEPEFMRVGKWLPDFVFHSQRNDHKGYDWSMIEYKPARPTETYLAELKSSVEALNVTGVYEVSALLVWVNWFTATCGAYVLDGDVWLEERKPKLNPFLAPIGSELAMRIRNHRFDLA